ncbi:glycosyltransferase, partial [Enterococcus faecalis]
MIDAPDDGSTDNSLNICKAYSLKDRRITVLTQPNQGVSSARNSGL